MDNLSIPELVESRLPSVATPPPETPALNRAEALEVLEQLKDALRRLRGIDPEDTTRPVKRASEAMLDMHLPLDD